MRAVINRFAPDIVVGAADRVEERIFGPDG